MQTGEHKNTSADNTLTANTIASPIPASNAPTFTSSKGAPIKKLQASLGIKDLTSNVEIKSLKWNRVEIVKSLTKFYVTPAAMLNKLTNGGHADRDGTNYVDALPYTVYAS